MYQQVSAPHCQKYLRQTHHYALWQIRLGERNGAHGSEHRDKDTVSFGRLERASDVAESAVVTFDVGLALESDGDAVERTDWLSHVDQVMAQLSGPVDGR